MAKTIVVVVFSKFIKIWNIMQPRICMYLLRKKYTAVTVGEKVGMLLAQNMSGYY